MEGSTEFQIRVSEISQIFDAYELKNAQITKEVEKEITEYGTDLRRIVGICAAKVRQNRIQGKDVLAMVYARIAYRAIAELPEEEKQPHLSQLGPDVSVAFGRLAEAYDDADRRVELVYKE